MLTFSDVTVTGEQGRVVSDYELGTMLRRGEPQGAPAAAWCEVFWHGVHVGRLERVDWLQLDPPDSYSIYWFRSLSNKTQVAARDKAEVLQRVEEILTDLTPQPCAVPQ